MFDDERKYCKKCIGIEDVGGEVDEKDVVNVFIVVGSF